MAFDQAAWARNKRQTDPEHRAKEKAAQARYRSKPEAIARAKKYRDAYRKAHKEYFRDYERASRRKDPTGYLLKTAKQRVKKKNLDFDIVSTDISPLPKYCPALGIEIKYGQTVCSGASPSIDRIDNNKGYVRGNVVVVSRKANAMKNDGSVDDLRRLLAFYEGITQ